MHLPHCGSRPRAGQKVLSLQTVPSQAADATQPGCVNAHGFSLHASVRCGAHQRKQLERLCPYIVSSAQAPNENYPQIPLKILFFNLETFSHPFPSS